MSPYTRRARAPAPQFTAVIITHPERSICVRSCMGLRFRSLRDSAGQDRAVTFPSEVEARDYVRFWENNNNPDDYHYLPVTTAENSYAIVAELRTASLDALLGELALTTTMARHPSRACDMERRKTCSCGCPRVGTATRQFFIS
jgi:hypothetical protein